MGKIIFVLFLGFFGYILFLSKNNSNFDTKNIKTQKYQTSSSQNNIFDTKNFSQDSSQNSKNNIISKAKNVSNNFSIKIYEVKNKKNIIFSSGGLQPGEDFVINGPLFGENFLPLGGYVQEGKTIQKFFSIKNPAPNFGLDNGIFGLGKDGKFYLIETKNYNKKINFLWAFQNGPLLVLNGKNRRLDNTNTKYPRSGIGYTKDGKLFVIYTPAWISLKDFGDIFLENGITNAIYLDGGGPAGYENKEGKFGNLNENAIKIHFF